MHKVPTTLQEAILYFANAENCRSFMVALRWTDGTVVCPRCGSENVDWLPNANLFKCYEKHPCQKFSLKVGTIFEDSPIPLEKWLPVMWLLANSKNGISSWEIHRAMGVTQKTAWFMLQRLRYASKTKSFNRSLSNTIEMDETYIGGKEKNKHNSNKTQNNQGRSTKTKTPVVGMKERGGEVRVSKVDNTKGMTIKNLLVDNVVIGSTVMTDEYMSYRGISFIYDHLYVKHSKGEYVNGLIHTNGIENFWSILKRGIVGIYHFVSPKHLDLYLDEFSFRYNLREMSEEERFNVLLSKVQGRLQYKELIAEAE
jgi:transposase-like protein